MKILFIGDVVGKPGKNTLKQLYPHLLDRYNIDFSIVNAENVAGGMGVTPKLAKEILNLKINCLTSGNHIWKKREIIPFLDEEGKILRPANYPAVAPGRGYKIFTTNESINVCVINLEGRIFMRPLDCPFKTASEIISSLPPLVNIIIVDFHAEATSEKQAMGRYLDGKVTAVLGTHTHVQTADDVILPGGTGYITDVGMTGGAKSIIGMTIRAGLAKMLSQRPTNFEISNEELRVQGVVVEVEKKNGKCLSIERISLPLEEFGNIP